MTIEAIFLDASSAMTVVSLLTFIGILGWTFSGRREHDFLAAAHLPFADDRVDADAEADADTMPTPKESDHG